MNRFLRTAACVAAITAFVPLARPLAQTEAVQAVLAGPAGRVAARVLTWDGIPYVSTTDLAASLGATKRWSSQSRRLEFHFSSGGNEHHLDFFVETPSVVLDQNPSNLPGPSRLQDGVVFVPLAGLSEVLSPVLPGGATWDPVWMTLHLGAVSSKGAEVDLVEAGTRTVLHARTPARPRIESSGAGLAVLLPGVTPGAGFTPPSPSGLVSNVGIENAPEGARLRLEVSPLARGYKVDAAKDSWNLELTADSLDVSGGGFSPFAESEFAAVEAVSSEDRARSYRRVVIDAGHGGWERGAVGELVEKNVTLEVAEELKRVLEDDYRFEVVLTRDDDEELTFDRRAEIVNASGADLYVTIHANGSFAASVHGPRVLVFRGGSVASVSERTIAGRRVQILPWTGVQARHVGASGRLAAAVAAEMGAGSDVPVLERPLRVLSSIDMPAVAVECGFLTNTEDAARLASDEKRSETAQAIARGIDSFARHVRGETEL